MITRIRAYLSAWRKVGIMNVREFIESELKQLSKNKYFNDNKIAVNEDGTTEIKEIEKDTAQETFPHTYNIQKIQQKHTEINMEIGQLDRRRRELEENITEYKDSVDVAKKENSAPEPFTREKRYYLFLLVLSFGIELIMWVIFCQDFFDQNFLHTFLTALGINLISTWVAFGLLESYKHKKWVIFTICLFIIIIFGIGIGYFKTASRMPAGDGTKVALLILFFLLTSGLSICQAYFCQRLSKAQSKLDSLFENERKFQPLIIKNQIELKQIEREKKDLQGRMAMLGKKFNETEGKRVIENKSEYISLKEIEAKLAIYREEYLLRARKTHDLSTEPISDDLLIRSKKGRETCQEFKILPFNQS
ncbi:hypothetical protein JXL19_11910 [bacterium]|nr:hypothetical protein [bacterium]